MQSINKLKIGDFVVLNEGGTIKHRFIKITNIFYFNQDITGINFEKFNGSVSYSGRNFWRLATKQDYKDYVDLTYKESIAKYRDC
jgi:hypothetical protein